MPSLPAISSLSSSGSDASSSVAPSSSPRSSIRMPSDLVTSGPAVSGVLLGNVEQWPNGVPLDVAVQRIDPTASNPYVQANAAGFRAGVVQITVQEYDTVLALHDEAGHVADQSPPRGQSS